MIAYLRGRVVFCQQNYVVMDVNGVGFKVFVAPSTVASLSRSPEEKEGREVILHVHFHLRQDGIELFGFLDPVEKVMFETLLEVDGIGPRVALGILCSSRVDDLVKAIMTGNERDLRMLPGVGPKTAKRMIVELKDLLSKKRFKDLLCDRGRGGSLPNLLRKGTVSEDASLKADTGAVATADETGLGDAIALAEAALISLGYSDREVREALNEVLNGGGVQGFGDKGPFGEGGIEAQFLVKSALKSLSRSKSLSKSLSTPSPRATGDEKKEKSR
ncbi:MAG TPA: Holliday junction branch migration protein RuvA [Clostridia bacterium]|nr:Holliday junction branch migration protein RuvA [Clostridia bacterium]